MLRALILLALILSFVLWLGVQAGERAETDQIRNQISQWR